MDKLIINGNKRLQGEINVSGAKNVAMKVLLASILTDEEIIINNIPKISSVIGTMDILRYLGVTVKWISMHSVSLKGDRINSHEVPLDLGGFYRTGTMIMGPLLARLINAVVPNPGGCRIGKRPIDRHVEGLKAMGAEIDYRDGYFYAKTKGLKGVKFRFKSNTHTGTETLILAAVLAAGETILENAAEEPEVDDLIRMLNLMGAQIKRIKKRTIVISGVKSLRGIEFDVMPDRNEVVTFAIAAIATRGELIVNGTQREYLKSFLDKLSEVYAGWEALDDHRTKFFYKKNLKATNMTTSYYPGFMTDWQAPWTLLMTQAQGISTVHETVYEDRFGYVSELIKMGAKIDFFQPQIINPLKTYNFNWTDRDKELCQAIKIYGKSQLHNAIVEVSDLRAGATLLIGSLLAEGESIITGIDHIDRGYERIEDRLKAVGADIIRAKV
jgi:UDP-N-acetylglucosamine 1-carboxyvinyltransferase